MAYRTVLLDLDHTLLDSDMSERDAFAHAFAAVGITDPAPLFAPYDEINRGLWADVERGTRTPDQVRVLRFELLTARCRLDVNPVELADAFVDGLSSCGDLYAGALEVLDELSAVATLALVTNGLGEVQRRRVDRLGLARYFDAVVISGEVGTAKPAADFFALCFDQLGQPPKATALMVGDSLSSDIAGGHGYGIDTCWYNPHAKVLHDDARHTVTHEIAQLGQLTSLVT